MLKRFKKQDILTIPNAMSVFRIVLIPIIIYTFCAGNGIFTVALVLLSAVTDIVDGKIARKYNMISDIGKMLDPVADKLTEFSLLLCLIWKRKRILLLLVLMAMKELVLIILGYLSLHEKDSVNSSKWYGKLCTVLIYACCVLLFLMPNLSLLWSNALIDICCVCVVVSAALYVRFYMILLRE